MKVEEVPQDNKYLDGTVMRDLTYAVDADGNYKAVQSLGWSPKNEAMEVTLDYIGEECEEIAQRVKDGQTSPLEYHITKSIMSVELLSEYTGIAKRKIRKHFKPEEFARLDDETLRKYAEALRISIDDLKKVPNCP